MPRVNILLKSLDIEKILCHRLKISDNRRNKSSGDNWYNYLDLCYCQRRFEDSDVCDKL